ncbi:hypothetical protein IV203_025261 [Nitzschia inconspicua]|uniref:Uncharacterized protein n=1 Tax=Nitzschia inconspicua TaxID=303405 RepID=A0A9K3K9J7_9STRA|nr:hypothetical protein IV203_024733 [Nitzschia inconspicua]KAG7362377.1 hypothetical protein IV203_025261 [Nitzschia inconspicua]
MFGINSSRSRSSLSRSSNNSTRCGGTVSRNRIDFDELDSLYDITRDDVKQFGIRKFKALCKTEGPEVAARIVDQKLRPQVTCDTGILDEADVWMNTENEVEVVLGATF